MPHLMGIVVIVGFPRPRRVVGQLELLLEVRWGSHIMEATSMIHSGISMMILRSIRVKLRAGQKVPSKEFGVLPCWLWLLLLMLERRMSASSAAKSLREGSLVLPLR
jgi:hypothetical protein